MNATHITVKKVDGNHALSTVVLTMFFVAGLLVGTGLVLITSGKIVLPHISPRFLLGAVVASNPPVTEPGVVASSSVVSETTTPTVATVNPAPVTVIDEAKVAAEKALSEKRTDLTLRINDRSVAIERLNQEIERVKNASVALIVEFNQNCGSWTDDCAKPYASKLEANNSSYNELVQKQTPLTLELTDLKAELTSLTGL